MTVTPDETIRVCRKCCQRQGQPHLLTCGSETLEARVAAIEEVLVRAHEAVNMLAELAKVQAETMVELYKRLGYPKY